MSLDSKQAEALFVEHLPVIDQLLAALGRRHRMNRDAADDFGSWAKCRLIENEYATIRKFRCESSLTTYLAVVLSMLLRDYRAQEWGRWRPSAAARRGGQLAVRLETLVYRDGLTLASAGHVLRTAGVTLSTDRELADLLGSLPDRAPLRPVNVGDDSLAQLESTDRADALVDAESTADEVRRVYRELGQALDALPDEDRLIVRMRFWQNMTVAEIARALGAKQKPLYRRIERAMHVVRDRCVTAGITWPIAGGAE